MSGFINPQQLLLAPVYHTGPDLYESESGLSSQGFTYDNAPFTSTWAPTSPYAKSESFGSSSDSDSEVEDLDIYSMRPREQVNNFSYPGTDNILIAEAEQDFAPYIPKTMSPLETYIYNPEMTLSYRDRLPPDIKTPSSKRKGTQVVIYTDSDDDAFSNGHTTDDEYAPPSASSSNPKKRSRSVRSEGSSSSSSSSSYASGMSAPAAFHGRPMKRMRRQPPSRNVQSATPNTLELIRSRRRSKSGFTCPECGWKQENMRSPDFKRHLKTHARPALDDTSKGWRCKGVLAEDRHHYPIPADAQSYLFNGQMRVGGCHISFSRRDALKRHIDNKNNGCVGHASWATND